MFAKRMKADASDHHQRRGETDGKTERHTRRLLKSLAGRGLVQRIGKRSGWWLTSQGASLLGLTPVQWIGEAADRVGKERDAVSCTRTHLNLRGKHHAHPNQPEERYGDRFVATDEESYFKEKPEFRQQEEVWLQTIPCRNGLNLPPFDDSHFVACTNHRGPIVNQLMAIPSARMWQDGDDGVNIIFDIDHFEEVVEVMKPRKRRHGRLSPETPKARRDGQELSLLNGGFNPPDGLERVPVPQADPE